MSFMYKYLLPHYYSIRAPRLFALYLKACVGLLLFTTGSFFVAGCSTKQGNDIFIPPSEFEPTVTPNWGATLEAGNPSQQTSIPTESQLLAEPSLTPVEAGNASSTPQPTLAITPTPVLLNNSPLLYYTQSGDTLEALAVRFGVTTDEIDSTGLLPDQGFINPNQLLVISQTLSNTTSSIHLLPDSEFVYSPSATDFDVADFVAQSPGYLKNYQEYLSISGMTNGGEIIRQLAVDNSVNPRLLLALLEYQGGWVYGQPDTLAEQDYPLGKIALNDKGLLRQLKWAVNELSIGYYGWREGRLNELKFSDGVTASLAPDLNAGTVALQYYFAQVFDSQGWLTALDPESGFPAFYESMFGNPWTRAQVVEPLFPPELTQPDLALPFFEGRRWSYTGGPHGAWERDGSWAAIDLAPPSSISGCYESDEWATASGDGVIVRSERGIVALDLDGDGFEQTGWVLIYLHVAVKGRRDTGEYLKRGDLVGHPSCEGGIATGTHIHFARKYNGEWMQADGPIPFVLSGWMVNSDGIPYKGTLTRNGEVVTANQFGAQESLIARERE